MSVLKSRPFWGILHSWTLNWVLGQLCCESKASPVYLWISREEEKADEHSCWDFACSRSQPFIGCICVFGSSVHVYLHTWVFVEDSSCGEVYFPGGKGKQLWRWAAEKIWADLSSWEDGGAAAQDHFLSRDNSSERSVCKIWFCGFCDF